MNEWQPSVTYSVQVVKISRILLVLSHIIDIGILLFIITRALSKD